MVKKVSSVALWHEAMWSYCSSREPNQKNLQFQQLRRSKSRKHAFERRPNLSDMITRRTNAMITPCWTGGWPNVSLWNNTQHLFSAPADSPFEQHQTQTKEQGVWKPADKHRSSTPSGSPASAFASAQCKQSAAPFGFIKADKWHSTTGR